MRQQVWSTRPRERQNIAAPNRRHQYDWWMMYHPSPQPALDIFGHLYVSLDQSHTVNEVSVYCGFWGITQTVRGSDQEAHQCTRVDIGNGKHFFLQMNSAYFGRCNYLPCYTTCIFNNSILFFVLVYKITDFYFGPSVGRQIFQCAQITGCASPESG